MPGPPAAIGVDAVSKRFRIAHGKATSLKELLVNRRRTTYEEFWALRDVTFEVAEGDTFGLIGENGSGKSTLLKCIAGILRPDAGNVRTRGRIASLLELGAGFHPDLTGRENVYMNASILGLSKRETDRHIDDIVAFAELEQFMDTQVKHYSSGMYVRLGFAVAVHVDPEILLVDEVLAVGDEAFQRKCLDRIRQFQKQGRTIVFVTHAVDLVRQICTRAAFLHHGRLEVLGPPNDAVRAYRQAVHGEAHLEAAPFEERGNREIRILAVALRDGHGAERRVFSPGEELEVVIDLEAVRRAEDWMVGVAIFDQRDDLAFGTNTDLRGMSLGPLEGKCRVRFRCGPLPFQDGTYHVTIGVTSTDHQTVYHWQEKAYSIRAVNTGPDVGALAVPIEISTEPM